jgi:hypothetical protein
LAGQQVRPGIEPHRRQGSEQRRRRSGAWGTARLSEIE